MMSQLKRTTVNTRGDGVLDNSSGTGTVSPETKRPAAAIEDMLGQPGRPRLTARQHSVQHSRRGPRGLPLLSPSEVLF